MSSDHSLATLSMVERIDGLCDRFEADWQAGRTPRIEDFVAQRPYPRADRRRGPLEQLNIAFNSGHNYRDGSITPPSHSILHRGNVASSFFTPSAVTWVSFRMRCSNPLRWTSPASLTCV